MAGRAKYWLLVIAAFSLLVLVTWSVAAIQQASWSRPYSRSTPPDARTLARLQTEWRVHPERRAFIAFGLTWVPRADLENLLGAPTSKSSTTLTWIGSRATPIETQDWHVAVQSDGSVDAGGGTQMHDWAFWLLAGAAFAVLVCSGLLAGMWVWRRRMQAPIEQAHRADAVS